MLLVGLAPLTIRLLLPFGEPHPRVHDEFSYVLAADTFAHGRAVNPVHPLWVHFESMHILVRPVYASIFPVAQGLMLAAGQIVTGHPWAGVWLSIGLMCASLCWMLQGWVSPGWAMLGGLLAGLRYGLLSYWMNSYFGGAMSAIGGALVLGALPRMRGFERRRPAVLLGLGLLILANSRPFEGLIFSLPAALWLLRSGINVRSYIAPLGIALALGAALMGWYFSRITGSPFVLPYAFYRSNFTMAPHFVWQSPRPEPVYHHRVLRNFYSAREMRVYTEARAHFWTNVANTVQECGRFFFGPILALPMLCALGRWRSRKARFLLLWAAFFVLALLGEVWHAAHYAAPATGLFLLLVILGMRSLRLWRWREWPVGQWTVALVVVGSVGLVAAGSAPEDGGLKRARIARELFAMEGRHLVLVRYTLAHDAGDEWVYNAAGIDGAKIVWAREMDPTSNARLLDYFRGRRVWLVQPDRDPPSLEPYDPSSRPDPPFEFVRLGAGAIEAISSPEAVRQKILRRVDMKMDGYTCDQWNWFFTDVTGVEAPRDPNGCFPVGRREQPVRFEAWFAWLLRQK